jgi:ABC-type multidrug transport system ATPase subunit
VSVLELEHIRKRYRRGVRSIDVLRDVSLQVDEREVIAIWGPRNSGRSTLLRIAAGIEAPDSGAVRFRGRRLMVGGAAITGGIAYCQPTLRSIEAELVLEELIGAQLALGIRLSGARARALAALERVQASHCEERHHYELSRAEAVRVAIARALLQEPALMIIDEPTTGVEDLQRDPILDLLGSLADEDGTAILMSLDKGLGLFAADRALSLGEGRLRGHLSRELAPVVELPRRARG